MNIIKGALAIALFLGKADAMDVNTQIDQSAEMIKFKVKFSNPEDAAKAHRNYTKAL